MMTMTMMNKLLRFNKGCQDKMIRLGARKMLTEGIKTSQSREKMTRVTHIDSKSTTMSLNKLLSMLRKAQFRRKTIKRRLKKNRLF